ncbi:MAG TPA: hypothetical protein VGN26_22945 [Armatimonadota bacterium]|jgi:hypothetical protein
MLFPIIALAVTLAPAAAPPTSLHLVTRTVRDSAFWRSQTNKPFVATTETWIQGGKLRQQDKVPAVGRVPASDSLRIIDGRRLAVFATRQPQKSLVTHTLPEQSRQAGLAQRVREYLMPKALGKRVGSARLLGHRTGIFELRGPGRLDISRTWVAEDLGVPLPLRVERNEADSSTLREVTRLDVNQPLRQDLFQAPREQPRTRRSRTRRR